MENNNENINRLVEDILDSFDGMSKAVPAPFLLTRINARILQGQSLSLWDRITLVLSRPSVAFAGLLLLLILDISIISFSKGSSASSALQEASQQTSDDEYAYSETTIYNLENTTP